MSIKEDTQHQIGKLLPEGAQRDAIHIAVAPVIAEEVLKPGDAIAFIEGSTERVRRYGTTIGIVDPFLSEMVQPGRRFYMFLHPNTITGLRHEWTHPAFPQEHRTFLPAGTGESEVWIRKHADELGIDYLELMYGADEWVRTSVNGEWGGEYITQHGSESWRDNFNAEEFWPHYERVRGVTVPKEHQESFFSCSC